MSQCNRPPQLPNSRKSHQDLGLFAPTISSCLEADCSTCTPVIGSPGKVAALMESQKVMPHLSALAVNVQWPYQSDKAYVILKVTLLIPWKNSEHLLQVAFLFCLLFETVRNNNKPWLQGDFLSFLFLEVARQLSSLKSHHHYHLHLTRKSAWVLRISQLHIHLFSSHLI